MIYVVVVVVIVIAILVVYLFRVSRASYARMRGNKSARNVNDPEAQMSSRSRATFPSMSGTARDVTNSLFRVPPEENDLYSAPHRPDRREGVVREVDAEAGQADSELPTYQETASMPAPPPASYQSPEMVRRQHRLQAAEQRNDEPPKYETQPIVREL